MGNFLADKKFYTKVLKIAIPIMIQNGITNFVNLLDNLMVGQIGTTQMSGVAIVNQIFFVLILCLFGSCSGVGIFTAQYYGKKDFEGVKNTTRVKILMAGILVILGTLIFLLFGNELINMFLHNESGNYNTAEALKSAKEYMLIMLIGIPPMALAQIYSSTLRETGETVIPMIAGIIAVFVNLFLNYVLIFEHFGYFGYGVKGAAIATVVSRFSEIMFMLIWAKKHKDKCPFFTGIYKKLFVPLDFFGKIARKALPILLNEALWSSAMTVMIQCYSKRGIEVVAAVNIANIIFNISSIAFIAFGDSIAIIVGQYLGQGKMKEAKETDTKLTVFAVSLCVLVGIVVVFAGPLVPRLYNTEKEVIDLASTFIIFIGIFMPINAFIHCEYFTLRAGGSTLITFLFDSCFAWAVNVSLAFILTTFTKLPIIPIYLICQGSDAIKAIIGFVLVKKGTWLNNLVDEQNNEI